jgi:hypothetical protein
MSKQIIETGLPLRTFVRGFLRDHLGMSKIASHLMADLFMERWAKRKATETDVRYLDQDDIHTLEATWHRLAKETVEARIEMPEMTKDQLREGIAKMRERKLRRQGVTHGPGPSAQAVQFIIEQEVDQFGGPRPRQRTA